jgi:hypothetical protein
LHQQRAAGYLDYERESAKFGLTAGAFAVLVAESSPVFLPPAFDIVASMWADEARLERAFKSGEGIGWGEHDPRLFGGCARFFGSAYAAYLEHGWLPALEGVTSKLRAGARVADIGCGHGISTVISASSKLSARTSRRDFRKVDWERDAPPDPSWSIRTPRVRTKCALAQGPSVQGSRGWPSGLCRCTLPLVSRVASRFDPTNPGVCMPFDTVQLDQVFLVRWLETPTLVDIRRLTTLILRASREGGRALLYVAIIPPELDQVPPPAVRTALTSSLRESLATTCESMDLVMLAPNVAGLMLRAAVRAMVVISGMGKKFFIHGSIHSALARLRPHIADADMFRRVADELHRAVKVGQAVV